MKTLTPKACGTGTWVNMGRRPSLPFPYSQQWNGRHFQNLLPRVPLAYSEILRTIATRNSKHSFPSQTVPVVHRTAAEFRTAPSSGLRVTWLGHSSTMMEIEGKRLLLDPVWGDRASPFAYAGVKRFHPPPLPLAELPAVDAILISHDHYDHLDRETVMRLAAKPIRWVVPLGVGSHLAYWGVSPELITELDWWKQTHLGDLQLACVPARHDSGRSVFLNDRQSTLWCGWSIRGSSKSVFYSGDSGLHDGFREVGERLGPFDISLIEIGAYDALWSDHHMGPEQAVMAHRLVKAKVMLPVHWATFKLAPHSWTEPIERLLVAAKEASVAVTLPKPGQSFEPDSPLLAERWWPKLPWRDSSSYPIQSTSVEHLHNERTIR